MKNKQIKIGDAYYINDKSAHYANQTVIILGKMFNQKANYFPCLVNNKKESVPLWDIREYGELL